MEQVIAKIFTENGLLAGAFILVLIILFYSIPKIFYFLISKIMKQQDENWRTVVKQLESISTRTAKREEQHLTVMAQISNGMAEFLNELRLFRNDNMNALQVCKDNLSNIKAEIERNRMTCKEEHARLEK
ncbi:MAG: hypothetical protein GY817_01245 [bacterium]|nr:hypothetical protein [bacterium]